MERVSGGGRRSRLLPGEDLPPSIGVGGGDPSASSKALAGRDAAIHWSTRQAMHQLWPRPVALPPPSPRTLPARLRFATAPRPGPRAWRRHNDRLCRATSGVQVAGGVVVVRLLAVGVRPLELLRTPSRGAAREERSHIQREGGRAGVVGSEGSLLRKGAVFPARWGSRDFRRPSPRRRQIWAAGVDEEEVEGVRAPGGGRRCSGPVAPPTPAGWRGEQELRRAEQRLAPASEGAVAPRAGSPRRRHPPPPSTERHRRGSQARTHQRASAEGARAAAPGGPRTPLRWKRR